MKEFRYEVEGIGQGHYTTSLISAVRGATQLSLDFYKDTIRLELFSHQGKDENIVLATFKKGQEQPRTFTTDQEDAVKLTEDGGQL